VDEHHGFIFGVYRPSLYFLSQGHRTGCRWRKKVAFTVESGLTFVQIHGLITLNNEGG
jgi:hypothetical protein